MVVTKDQLFKKFKTYLWALENDMTAAKMVENEFDHMVTEFKNYPRTSDQREETWIWLADFPLSVFWIYDAEKKAALKKV